MRMWTCVLGVVVAVCAQGASMTKGERERLIAHLQMTEAWLADETSHLSREQLEYHPSPEQWSVIDVVEHLNLAEPVYWRQFHDALKQPVTGEKPRVGDLDVLWYGVDRTVHQKTSPNKVPKSGSTDLKARLDAFRKLHGEMLDYTRGSNDDLRGRLIDKEGTDAYQWLLMISTHAQRHILQIREIKASPGFPKT